MDCTCSRENWRSTDCARTFRASQAYVFPLTSQIRTCSSGREPLIPAGSFSGSTRKMGRVPTSIRELTVSTELPETWRKRASTTGPALTISWNPKSIEWPRCLTIMVGNATNQGGLLLREERHHKGDRKRARRLNSGRHGRRDVRRDIGRL